MSVVALTNEEIANALEATIARAEKAERNQANLFDAYERLKAEKNATISLWQHRAEAMASPRTDADFTEDENDWRKKSVKALEANGWLPPLEAARLHAEIANLTDCAPKRVPADLEDP